MCSDIDGSSSMVKHCSFKKGLFPNSPTDVDARYRQTSSGRSSRSSISFNRLIARLIPMIREADFRAAWWLPTAHLQTLWPTLCRRGPKPPMLRERLELPDGDFLDIDWTLTKKGPIVLILHGLEGSSDSGYARGLLAALTRLNWRGAVMHFRGCSGEPNRLKRSYDAGGTNDLGHVVNLLREREPATSLACVGYSIGGNVLLKWLGETGAAVPLQAAVAVSVPFNLDGATRRLQQGFSRIYQAYLLRHLHSSYRRKFRSLSNPPVPPEEISQLTDFYSYDDRVTAPLHGYLGVEDYYRRASCRQYLRGIRIPTLILHARDDPFMSAAVIPAAGELSDWVTLELSRRGGHVGFVSGPVPWRAKYWLEQRIPEFLTPHLQASPGAFERGESRPRSHLHPPNERT
jgi:predicted alpha/beta-fold hydrolase